MFRKNKNTYKDVVVVVVVLYRYFFTRIYACSFMTLGFGHKRKMMKRTTRLRHTKIFWKMSGSPVTTAFARVAVEKENLDFTGF